MRAFICVHQWLKIYRCQTLWCATWKSRVVRVFRGPNQHLPTERAKTASAPPHLRVPRISPAPSGSGVSPEISDNAIDAPIQDGILPSDPEPMLSTLPTQQEASRSFITLGESELFGQARHRPPPTMRTGCGPIKTVKCGPPQPVSDAENWPPLTFPVGNLSIPADIGRARNSATSAMLFPCNADSLPINLTPEYA